MYRRHDRVRCHCSLLVIVNYLHVLRSRIGPEEADPPLPVYPDAVLSGAVTCQLLQPANYHAPKQPDTDFSVVMNARTGVLSDLGEGNHWPLPLSKVGTVVSLPPQC